MDFRQFLQEISPGITTWGVFLTLALAAFAVGKHFWNYEKELVSENISRLRDLMVGFRRRHLEPLLRTQLEDAMSTAYGAAIAGLIEDIHPRKRQASGEMARQVVEDEVLKALTSTDALDARLAALRASDAVERFLASASGEGLLDDFDAAYERRTKIAKGYRSAKVYCERSCYSFLTLSLLLLIGLIRLIHQWPAIAMYFWAFSSCLAFGLGVYSSIRLELSRKELLHHWEELQVHGEI